MFTGIVQAKCRLAALEDRPFGKRLVIDCADWTPPAGYTPAAGDSICISGTCLTVVEFADNRLHFDVIAETLDKTKLGDLRQGDHINIEPSVTPNQPLGGHFMQGHVDGVGTITRVINMAEESRVTVRPPADLMPYIIPKGSVAIDGISLTLASIGAGEFDVALIPTTLELTTLGAAEVGQRVNLEADIIAKTVVTTLQRMVAGGEEVSFEMLRQAGFVEGD